MIASPPEINAGHEVKIYFWIDCRVVSLVFVGLGSKRPRVRR